MMHRAWLLGALALGAVVGLAWDRAWLLGVVVGLVLIGQGARRWLRTERYIEEGHGPW